MAEEVELVELRVKADQAIATLQDVAKSLASLDKQAEETKKRHTAVGEALTGAYRGLGEDIKNLVLSIPGHLNQAFKSVVEHMDKLNAMSVRLNMSREGLQRIGEASARANVPLEMIARSASMLSRNLYASKDSFEKYGISLKEMKGLNTEEQFLKVATAIQKIQDPAKQAAASFELLRDRGGHMLQFIRSDFVKAMAEVVPISEEQSKSIAETAEKMGALSRASRNLWEHMVAGVAGSKVFQEVLQLLMEGMASLTQWFKDNSDAVEEWTNYLLLAAAQGLQVVITGIDNLVTSLTALYKGYVFVKGGIEMVVEGLKAQAQAMMGNFKPAMDFKKTMQGIVDDMDASLTKADEVSNAAHEGLNKLSGVIATAQQRMEKAAGAGKKHAEVTKQQADSSIEAAKALEQQNNQLQRQYELFAKQQQVGSIGRRGTEGEQELAQLHDEAALAEQKFKTDLKVLENKRQILTLQGKEERELNQQEAQLRAIHKLEQEGTGKKENLAMQKEADRIYKNEIESARKLQLLELDLANAGHRRGTVMEEINYKARKQAEALELQRKYETQLLALKMAQMVPGSAEYEEAKKTLAELEKTYAIKKQILEKDTEEEKRQERLVESAKKWSAALQGVNMIAGMIGGKFGEALGKMAGIGDMLGNLRQKFGSLKGAMSDKSKGGGRDQMMGGLIGGGLGILGGLFGGENTTAGRALGGAAQGVQAGSAFGPMGMAIGGAIGGLIGLFHKPAWVKVAKEAGKILGEKVSKEMAEEIQRRAKESGKSIAEIAKEMKIEKLFAQKQEDRNKLVEGLTRAASGFKTIMDSIKIFNNSALSASAQVLGDKVRDAMMKAGLGYLVEGSPLATSEKYGAARAAAQGTAEVVGGMTQAGKVDVGLMAAAGQTAAELLKEATAAATEAGLAPAEASKAGFGAVSDILREQLNASIASGQELDSNTKQMIADAKAQGLDILPDIQYQQLDELKKITANTAAAAGGGAPPAPGTYGMPGSPDMPHGRAEYGAASGMGPVRLSKDTVIQAHAGEHVLIVPKGKNVHFRKAMRGAYSDSDREDTREPGTGGAGGATAPAASSTPVVSVAEVSEIVKAAVEAAAKNIQQVQVQQVVSPTINVDPLKNAQDRQQYARFVIEETAKEVRSKQGSLVFAIQELLA